MIILIVTNPETKHTCVIRAEEVSKHIAELADGKTLIIRKETLEMPDR